MASGRKKKRPDAPDQRVLVSAFIDALIDDDPQQVRALLESGLDLNSRYDGTGRAVLHLCAQGGTVKIAEVLMEHGADVHSLDPWGMTTVVIAARWGSASILRLFLELGVDPNVPDNADGMTPLSHAMCADEDRSEHIRLLLEHGADPDVPDDRGRTARDLAELLSQRDDRPGTGYAALLPPKREGAPLAPRSPRKKPTQAEIGVRITTESDPVPTTPLLSDMFEEGQDLSALTVHKLVPDLSLPGGRLVGTDYLGVLDGRPFSVELQPGDYTVNVVKASTRSPEDGPVPEGAWDERRVAFVRIMFTDEPAVSWEPAQLVGSPDWHGFGVDHGMAALFDQRARDGLHKLSADVRWPEVLYGATADCGHDWAHVSFEGGSAVVCSTGWGDGVYSCFLGLAESGSPCCLVADFAVVGWKLSDLDEE